MFFYRRLNYIIDVQGNVKITNLELEEFPEYIKFNDVTGFFLCANCRKLKSLKGCPKKAESFLCYHCDSIVDLKGSPDYVKDEFNCGSCNLLKSLNGAPKRIGGSLFCDGCQSLETFDYSYGVIEKDLSCCDCNSLKNFNGCPNIKGYLSQHYENPSIDISDIEKQNIYGCIEKGFKFYDDENYDVYYYDSKGNFIKKLTLEEDE